MSARDGSLPDMAAGFARRLVITQKGIEELLESPARREQYLQVLDGAMESWRAEATVEDILRDGLTFADPLVVALVDRDEWEQRVQEMYRWRHRVIEHLGMRA